MIRHKCYELLYDTKSKSKKLQKTDLEDNDFFIDLPLGSATAIQNLFKANAAHLIERSNKMKEAPKPEEKPTAPRA